MIDQVIIGVCGISSVYCSQDHRGEVRKWACLFGLLAQPAWFYSSFQAGQWGILCLTFVYTLGWMRGFYNNWIRKT